MVLNEVAIQPNQVVELYNTASTSADVSAWYIDDAGGSTYFIIPSQTILSPQSCAVFSSDFNFNKASADTVRLFDNTSPPTSSSAKLVEQYLYPKAPDINFSFSKKMDGGTEWQTTSSSLGLFNEFLTSCIPTLTPTPSPTEIPIPTSTTAPSPLIEPTLAPSPTSLPDYLNIFISEVYPYPQTGEYEWVELYNGNSMQVNLDHWYIDDGENTGSAPKSFSRIIEANSYGFIDISSSLFNNSGDVVRLLDSDKNEKDGMEFTKMKQGKSMGRISFDEDSYCEQEPSKNSENSSCISIQTPSPTSTPVRDVFLTSSKKIPVAKPLASQQPKKTGTSINVSLITPSPQKEEVLGAQVQNSVQTSPAPYLSFVSFSYSLLTIVSLFIKMKYA